MNINIIANNNDITFKIKQNFTLSLDVNLFITSL